MSHKTIITALLVMAAILTVASCSNRPFANSKNIDMTRLANDPSIRYAILSLQDDRPVLNSFRILSGQVVDTEHHL
jgi:hypothetical protein